MKVSSSIRGQRLRRLRRELKLKQQDICGTLHRSTVGRYESGEIAIDEKSAVYLVNNINAAIMQKKIKHDLIPIEFLLDDYYEINLIVKEMLAEFQLNKITNSGNFEILYKQVVNITDICDQNNAPNIIKIEAYECFIDFFCENRKFEYSRLYTFKCIELINENDIDNLMIYFNKIITIYKMHNLNEEIISLCRYSLLYEKLITNEEIKKNFYYNLARSYSKLKNSSESKKWALIYKSYFNLSEEDEMKANILIANCYFRDRNFEAAEKIYLELFPKALINQNGETLSVINNNLAYIYILKNEFKKANDTIYTLLSINKNIIKERMALNEYYAILVFIKTDNLNYIENNYLKTLQDIQYYKVKENQLELIYRLFDYFKSKQKSRCLESLLDFIKQKIENKDLNDLGLCNLFFMSSDYFFYIDSNKCNMYNRLGIKLYNYLQKAVKEIE